jgi:hypothetical protein
MVCRLHFHRLIILVLHLTGLFAIAQHARQSFSAHVRESLYRLLLAVENRARASQHWPAAVDRIAVLAALVSQPDVDPECVQPASLTPHSPIPGHLLCRTLGLTLHPALESQQALLENLSQVGCQCGGGALALIALQSTLAVLETPVERPDWKPLLQIATVAIARHVLVPAFDKIWCADSSILGLASTHSGRSEPGWLCGKLCVLAESPLDEGWAATRITSALRPEWTAWRLQEVREQVPALPRQPGVLAAQENRQTIRGAYILQGPLVLADAPVCSVRLPHPCAHSNMGGVGSVRPCSV